MKGQNCKLCKNKKANKTGSHIIPHFLLKRIENIDGSNLRDKELGFSIYPTKTTFHYGRSVLPEQLEEIIEKFTEDDLVDNKNPMVKDYYFCSYCEEKFSKIESIYASTRNTSENSENGLDGYLSVLFWISIFWRISLLNEYQNLFSKKHSETFRKLLNQYLINSGEYNENEILESPVMNRFTLKILKSDLKKDDTSHFFLHPRFRIPYSMILHDYVITLSLTGNHNIFINSNLHGIREEILEGKITKVNSKEVLNQLSRDKILETNTNVVNDIAKGRFKLFEGILDKIHKKLGGKGSKMYPELKQLIFFKLSEENNNYKLLDIEDLTKNIFEVFVKQGLVQN